MVRDPLNLSVVPGDDQMHMVRQDRAGMDGVLAFQARLCKARGDPAGLLPVKTHGSVFQGQSHPFAEGGVKGLVCERPAG